MGEILKKPYEISVWEDELVTQNDESYYIEKKVAIIGSDKMVSPNRVLSPVLKTNINGEKTLTFSLQFRYFDEKIGEIIQNPIYSLLFNERKIKLYYDNQWFDFIIKECEENKEDNTFSYVAKDIFINELSKQGYNITFDTELNNNLGTVVELGKEVLKNTDWVVDEDDCDVLKQTIEEPLYTCKVINGFQAINLDTEEIINIIPNETIYIFYSYISNKDVEYLQFIRKIDYDTNKWLRDDKDIIIATNYRYDGTLIVNENDKTISDTGETVLINIQDPSYLGQAYRLVYQNKTTYDPITGEYVQLYKVDYYGDTQEVYKFTSSQYSTSTLVKSIVSNGNDFETTTGNKILGWSNSNLSTNDNFPLVDFATYPSIEINSSLVPLSVLDGVTSYMRLNYPNTLELSNGKYCNTIFNSGFMDSGATIGNIAKGEKYVLRARIGSGEKDSLPAPIDLSDNLDAIKVFVAFYQTESKVIEGVSQSLKTFRTEDIIFNFSGDFFETPNIISNGHFNETKTTYIIDKVVQTPSLKYYYKEEGDENDYIWDPSQQKYILLEENENYLKYYSTVAKSEKTVSNKELTDPQVRIGIFISTLDPYLTGENYIYVEDIQIFKYLSTDSDDDGIEEMLLPGNIPTAKVINNDNYYLKPEEGTTIEEINLYSSLEDLANDLNIDVNNFYRVYNDNCEKILTIKESKSNCFNILQTLCETFECWLKVTVEHERNGAIKLDENNHPIKKISFKEFIGRDNFAGFRYGINLNSIVRSIDSNEVVTKLIVEQTASDYNKSGNLNISLAEANPTGESCIYNLDYYLQKGLIKNREQYLRDLADLYRDVKALNNELRLLENEYTSSSTALDSATSSSNVYVQVRETAQEDYLKALKEFEDTMGCSYSEFLERESHEIDEKIIDIVKDIYAAASLLNNTGGITTISNEEYKRLKLEVEGAKTYGITVSTVNGSQDQEDVYLAKTKLILSDYIEGFHFSFQRDNDKEEFVSTVNKKEFELLTDRPYVVLNIISIPDNYQLEYTIDGETYSSKDTGVYQFVIYDDDNSLERIRRFKLVPDSDYAAAHPSYIQQINEKIKEKDEYIKKFERKYTQFIQEGTWGSTNYIDSDLYYFDAVQVGRISARPKISYTINVTEVSEIDGLENYNFKIGDKTYIEDTEFFGWQENSIIIENEEFTSKTPIKEEVVLSEIEWHLDEPEQNVITVQNYKTQFEDLFQRISAAVQTVQYNEANYSRVAGLLNSNGTINADVLAKSLGALGGVAYTLTGDGALEVSKDGLLIKDLTNPQRYLRIISKGIQTSLDGGKTWKDAITTDGIDPGALKVGYINVQNITIIDEENTSFRWDKDGLSAYGFNEDGSYDLTSFVRMDKYGLYGIKNDEDYVVSSLEDLLNKAYFSLTWDGFRLKNSYGNGYVSISTDNDFEVIKTIDSQDITKIKIGATEKDENGQPIKYGINIKNDEGETVFTTDDDGNIVITGTINANAGIIGGFNVDNELYSGEFGEFGSIYLSPGHSGILPVGGINNIQNWVITAGPNFGVTSSGKLYAEDANISGNINATNGRFSGYIEAYSGQFKENITIGSGDRYVKIVAPTNSDSLIASSDYIKNTSMGWAISGSGDAIFNNVSVRGAIKTAVFEYSEIEAVGGAFLFRPSSSIKTAEIVGNDVVVTVDKPLQFRVGEWVKTSNCIGESSGALINDGGLNHVYKIINNVSTQPLSDGIILENAAQDFTNQEIIINNLIDEEEPLEDEIDYDSPINIVDFNDYDELRHRYYYEINEIPTGDVTPDTELETGENYYIDFKEEKYKLAARTIEVNYIFNISSGTSGERIDYIDNRLVTYIGNLSLVYPNQENTGEPFVIITGEENNVESTRLYIEDSDSKIFYIQKLETPSNVYNIDDLVGGALISFGYDEENSNYEDGIHNYGIGINSSDNYINLPERAISLFESKIYPNRSVKVAYDYKGILGTLPASLGDLVNNSVYQHMGGTQGIFTNNMYIGDADQYLAFYTNQQNNKKELVIQANQILFKAGGTEEQPIYKDVTEIDAEAGLQTIVLSTLGDQILNSQGKGAIYVRVLHGDTEIDPVGDSTIEAGEDFPNNPSNGDRFILLEEIVENNTSKTIATLYIYNSQESEWGVQDLEATYEWTFRNKNNEIIESSELLEKFRGAYDQSTGKVVGKCLYLDADVIDNKITAEVKVTIN